MLELFNYCLVTLFGIFLSAQFAGGWRDARQRNFLWLLSLLLLLLQGIFWMAFDVDTVRKLYPLIVHLPLVLVLVFQLKKPLSVSVVSVFTAYLCCQVPRWMKLAAAAATGSPLAGEICYTIVIFALYGVLHRFFVRTVHEAMTQSTRVLFLFGGLPFVYYLFDYAAVVYADLLHSGNPVLVEFIPTALAIFFIAFLTTYHALTQKKAQAELEKNILHTQLKQSGLEVQALRQTESQTAIYQHNMRYHLTAIEGFLSAGSTAQAQAYIRKVHQDIEAITPRRVCENELVNLVCSAFLHQAEQQNIRFSVDARLPQDLAVSDTELCAILSNGLENAFHAVRDLEPALRWVEFFCGLRANSILLEVINPYEGTVTLRDGLPVSTQEGHGFGCRSIRAVADQYRGLCSFEAVDGLFTFRVVLPNTSL